MQGHIFCAEANLGNNKHGPLLVVAVGQNVLSWNQYAQQFPAAFAASAAFTRFGHFHPAVQEAAHTKVYTVGYSLHQTRAIRLILQSLFSKLCNSALSVHVSAIW